MQFNFNLSNICRYVVNINVCVCVCVRSRRHLLADVRYIPVTLCFTISNLSPIFFSILVQLKTIRYFSLERDIWYGPGNILTNIIFLTPSGIFQNLRDLCNDHGNWKFLKVHLKITHKWDMTHQKLTQVLGEEYISEFDAQKNLWCEQSPNICEKLCSENFIIYMNNKS